METYRVNIFHYTQKLPFEDGSTVCIEIINIVGNSKLEFYITDPERIKEYEVIVDKMLAEEVARLPLCLDILHYKVKYARGEYITDTVHFIADRECNRTPLRHSVTESRATYYLDELEPLIKQDRDALIAAFKELT